MAVSIQPFPVDHGVEPEGLSTARRGRVEDCHLDVMADEALDLVDVTALADPGEEQPLDSLAVRPNFADLAGLDPIRTHRSGKERDPDLCEGARQRLSATGDDPAHGARPRSP